MTGTSLTKKVLSTPKKIAKGFGKVFIGGWKIVGKAAQMYAEYQQAAREAEECKNYERKAREIGIPLKDFLYLDSLNKELESARKYRQLTEMVIPPERQPSGIFDSLGNPIYLPLFIIITSIFFLSPNITGNTIFAISKTSTNFLGIGLFMLAICMITIEIQARKIYKSVISKKKHGNRSNKN